MRVLILADLPASELPRVGRALRATAPDWIVLPRSGAIGKSEARALRSLAPRRGFIAAGLNPRFFDAAGKIFLRTRDWGNLVFAE